MIWLSKNIDFFCLASYIKEAKTWLIYINYLFYGFSEVDAVMKIGTRMFLYVLSCFKSNIVTLFLFYCCRLLSYF